MCVEAGLVRDGELFFDATRVEADASIDSLAPRFAVEAHLSELFEDSSTPENRAVEAPRMKPEALPQAATLDFPEPPFSSSRCCVRKRHRCVLRRRRRRFSTRWAVFDTPHK